MKTISLIFAAALLVAGTTAGEAAGRIGAHRVGGHGPNGKGSHYVGGHKSTAIGRFVRRHL